MSKQAVIYARVSTDDQTKGYSLPTQLEACRRYASERSYSIAAEFSDDYTGSSLDRPALNELRQSVGEHSVNVVIVYDVDRLARKSIYQMLIEEELSHHGVSVEYVVGQYADTDEGRLQKQIRASIAEYEKAKILERSKRGKRGKAKSGFVIVGARPPYGYYVKSEPHKTWLEIDEDEARVVRMVFDWYVYGDETGKRLSINQVAKRLTSMSIPTRGDKQAHFAKKVGFGVWQPAMVTHILKNEAYIGVWYFGKTHIVSDGKEATRRQKPKCGLGKQVARPREDWVSVAVPSIVDDAIWKAAQVRLEDNKRTLAGRPPKHEYLLSHRLRCGHCGYGTRGQTRDERRYYLCNGRRQVVSLCKLPAFRGDIVDDLVWDWVKGLLKDPARIAEGLRASQHEAEQSHSGLRDRFNIIEAQLNESKNQLSRLIDLYLAGEFPKEMLTERKTRLEATIADLTREQAELSAHLDKLIMTDEQIAELENFCAEVRQGLDSATLEDKRRYFELLDLHGTLMVENGEKVIYVQCKIGLPQRLQIQILHS